MSLDPHIRAERLMSEAEEARLRGDPGASNLYAEAADWEARAFELQPRGMATTRGLLAVSAVSLYSMAQRTDEASRLAHQYLAAAELPLFAQTQLLDLIVQLARAKQATARGTRLARDTFEVTLSGEAVRVGGMVQVETLVSKLQHFERLAVRVAEYVTGQPVRHRGSPRPEIADLCRPLVSPALAGSYRFELTLETPSQLPLLPEAELGRVSPDTIATEFFDLLDVVATTPENTDERIRIPEYREVLLKLIRNLVPTGRDLDEVSVSNLRTGATTVLRPPVRTPIQQQIRALRMHQPVIRETERHGILRALDLDQGWLRLVEAGAERTCKLGAGQFDDVLGPLVNRSVVVVGQWSGNSFVASDVYESESEATPSGSPA